MPDNLFSSPKEYAEWLLGYGVSAVYIIPKKNAFQVCHPMGAGYDWHGTRLYKYFKGYDAHADRALKSALRWAATEYDVGSWGIPFRVGGKAYFPLTSLKFTAKEIPDFKYRRAFGTKAYRDVLEH